MLKNWLYRLLSRLIFPNKGIARSPRTPRVVVSLTSHPARIGMVSRVVETLLRQTLKPDVVVLWLADSQFPHREADLPRALRRLCKAGLTISWCADIRSYKKLVPAIKQFPEDIVVTADDDILYPEWWLERLYTSWLRYPDQVQCHHVFCIALTESDTTTLRIKHDPGLLGPMEVPGGGGGVLYPPHALHPDVCNVDLFSQIAPTNDDYWFLAMTLRVGTKVRLVEGFMSDVVDIEKSKSSSLASTGNANGESGRQLRNIVAHYPEISQPLLGYNV